MTHKHILPSQIEYNMNVEFTNPFSDMCMWTMPEQGLAKRNHITVQNIVA